MSIFESLLTTFEASGIFRGSRGGLENGLNLTSIQAKLVQGRFTQEFCEDLRKLIQSGNNMTLQSVFQAWAS